MDHAGVSHQAIDAIGYIGGALLAGCFLPQVRPLQQLLLFCAPCYCCCCCLNSTGMYWIYSQCSASEPLCRTGTRDAHVCVCCCSAVAAAVVSPTHCCSAAMSSLDLPSHIHEVSTRHLHRMELAVQFRPHTHHSIPHVQGKHYGAGALGWTRQRPCLEQEPTPAARCKPG